VSDSGISWAICKSAPRSRQITMPVPYHSVFLQAGCPSCRPTNSVKALKALKGCLYYISKFGLLQVRKIFSPCHAGLHRWVLARSSSCGCGRWRAMGRIVDMCPLTGFEGRLNLLQEADDDTVIWLEVYSDCSTRKIINNN